MAEIHRRNAERLDEIVQTHGWPGQAGVGEEASHAAFLVLQHAIGSPEIMRRCLPLLQTASAPQDVDPVEMATLEDRILTIEGLPQRYGTQFDWDENGVLSPLPIVDPAGVDERRQAVGLDSLADNVARIRAEARREDRRRPADPAAHTTAADSWAQAVGWRH